MIYHYNVRRYHRISIFSWAETPEEVELGCRDNPYWIFGKDGTPIETHGTLEQARQYAIGAAASLRSRYCFADRPQRRIYRFISGVGFQFIEEY